MKAPRVSLDQWRALAAVVDTGSYAKAAELLNKSQSSVTYAVQQLESSLGIKAFEIKGRKAALTPTGELLYRRGRILLEDADALLRGQATLAILPVVPQGFAGDPLMRLRFVLVAHPGHPLHQLGKPVTMRDLRAHRQLLVRESSAQRSTKLAIEATQRWTVSNMATSIGAACRGYGYAWFPEDKIRTELAGGALKILQQRDGGERFSELYLVFADRDAAGPGTLRLAEIIRAQVAETCKEQ